MIDINKSRNTIIHGNAMDVLPAFPSESIDTIITSPPYFGLRSYHTEPQIWGGDKKCEHQWKSITHKIDNLRLNKIGINTDVGSNKETEFRNEGGLSESEQCIKCGAWRGELGREQTVELFVSHLCDIFNECKRVLKKTGSLWVNISDTYGGSGGGHKEHEKHSNSGFQFDYSVKTGGAGNKHIPKSLLLVPERFVIEMCSRDTMDIYELDKNAIICKKELDKGYIMCYDICDEKIGGKDAIQRRYQSEGIQYQISKEMESRTPSTISQADEGLERKEQRQNPTNKQKVLLDKQGKRNNQSNEGQCKEASQIKNGCDNEIWWKSSQMCLLWGTQNDVFNNRPYKQRWKQTQEGNEKQILLNLRMVKENELSKRFQSFVYELQLGNREVWILPPSRGRNICIRKKDIPIELLPLFKLYKEERWLLRNTIIWEKPNCMPEACTDRFTRSFEYIYLFVKSNTPQYWYNTKTGLVVNKCPAGINGVEGTDWDWKQIEEYPGGEDKQPLEKSKKVSYWKVKDYYFEQQFDEYTKPMNRWGGETLVPNGKSIWDEGTGQTTYRERNFRPNPMGRNKRNVWTVNTKPLKDAHFATFPIDLITPMILAGCPEFVCSSCGLPQSEVQYTHCNCKAEFNPGIVLDTFMGAGTVGVVAKQYGRDFIGIELNKEYIDIAEKRIAETKVIKEDDNKQLGLF